MAEWLRQNWGNLASVIGLVISLVAWWKARSAEAAVHRVQDRERLIHLLMNLEHALHSAEGLQRTRARKWPAALCDDLHACLSAMQYNSLLTDDQHHRFRVAVNELRVARENNPQAKAWIGRLVESLIDAKNRAIEQLQELEHEKRAIYRTFGPASSIDEE